VLLGVLTVGAHATSIGLQLLGLVLASLGVGVVRRTLAQVPDAIDRATGRIVGWLSRLMSALRSYWQRFARRQPVVYNATANLRAGAGLTATAVVHRSVPDRAVVTDGEWLHLLDAQMTNMYERVEELEKDRIGDRQTHLNLLGAQGGQLRAEIRAGSGYVIAGLLFSFTGTVLGFWS
jgi:hypothetical protein